MGIMQSHLYHLSSGRELAIPVNGRIFITDKGYEYLISLFKEEVPKRKISRLMDVPLKQIEEEHERWTLYQAIYSLGHQFRYPEVWNGGKRFGPAL